MSIWATLAAPFTSVVEGIGGYFKEKQVINAEKSKRKDELKKKSLEAKIASIQNMEDSAVQQDNEARGLAGWMDDISFYIFLAPVPLVFIPGMEVYITAGFMALEGMPEYYKYALGLMLASVWGYKRLVLPIVQVAVATWAKKMSINLSKEP